MTIRFRFNGLHRALRMVALPLFGLPVVVALGQSTPPTYYFTTLAGASSVGSADGPAGVARFNGPSGVAVDAAGNIYVADSGNKTVRRITPAGVVSTVAGKPGDARSVDGSKAMARFRSADQVAVDRLGVIYVGDALSIRRIGLDGGVTTLAGYPDNDPLSPSSVDGIGTAARFNGITGLAVGPAGQLYASDPGGSSIRQITSAGVVSTLAGGSPGATDGTGAGASFSGSGGSASDGAGVTTRFYGPGGLAVDAGGNIYVADGSNNIIRKVTSVGTVTTIAGRAGVWGALDGVGSAALFRLPRGATVDLAGNVYVADTFNQTIRRVEPSGQVTTLAGQPPAASPTNDLRTGTAGSADGTGREASFYYPSALAIDPAGNIVVADHANNTIRRITPVGAVATVAGLPRDKSAGSTDGTAAGARFSAPRGIAVTATGVCYVADSGNHVIRRIAPDGTVSTLAGTAGQSGYADGAGAAARFRSPHDLALDREGNLFVIDANATIRKITSEGVVTTLAGSGRVGDPVDGQGGAAVFWGLTAIAIAPDGNIWVSEYSGRSPDGIRHWPARLRKVTPTGIVTTENLLSSNAYSHTAWNGLAFDAAGTLYACDATYGRLLRVSAAGEEVIHFNFAPQRIAVAANGQVFLTEGYSDATRVARLTADAQLEIIGGQRYQPGHQDGIGSDALFTGATGISVDAAGSLYVACTNHTIRKGVLASAPAISTQPASQTVTAGSGVTLSVAAAAVPEPTYQWQVNGTPIPGATTSTLSFSNARSSDAGDYAVVVTNELGTATSARATLTVTASQGSGSGNGAGSSGGGGAPSLWFLLAAGMVMAMRLAGRQGISTLGEKF